MIYTGDAPGPGGASSIGIAYATATRRDRILRKRIFGIEFGLLYGKVQWKQLQLN